MELRHRSHNQYTRAFSNIGDIGVDQMPTFEQWHEVHLNPLEKMQRATPKKVVQSVKQVEHVAVDAGKCVFGHKEIATGLVLGATFVGTIFLARKLIREHAAT